MVRKQIISPKTSNIFIVSNGCVPNKLAGKKISQILENCRYKIIDCAEYADIIIFNSCAYSGIKMRESGEILNDLIRKKQDNCKIIITGCIDKINPDFKKGFNKCVALDIHAISKYLGAKYSFDDLDISDTIIDTLETTKKGIFNIITSKGCLGSCSYCAIKKARGILKSKSISDIIEEFKNGIDKGFRKLVLWGDDFGAYGKDIKSSYTELLRSIMGAIPSYISYQLYLHRLNAQWIISSIDELSEILSTNRIKMIYSPVQSGSNKILKLMNRHYKAEDVIGCFKKIKQYFPNVLLKTDIMVGFPTEKGLDVEKTINLIKEIRFDEIVVFKYSGIPETTAYAMNGQITEEEKRSKVFANMEIIPFLRYMLELENKVCWIIDKGEGLKVPVRFNSYMSPL